LNRFRFGFKFLFTLFLLVGLLFLTELFFDFALKNNMNIKLSFEQKTTIPFDGVIHGPCEPLFSIDPEIIEDLTGLKLLNIAQRHTDFADNYLQLYLYLQKHPKTKLVLLYVTPESFDVRFNTFHSYRYAPYLQDTVVCNVVKDMDPKFAKCLFLPMMKYTYYNYYKNAEALQGLKHWWQKDSVPYFTKGYAQHASVKDFNGYTLPQNLVFHNFVSTTELENKQLYYDLYADNESFNWDVKREQYLLKIIQLCKKNHTKLVLMESPVYSPALQNQANRLMILQKIKSLANQNQIPFWLFYSLPMNEVQDNFVSALILSRKGTLNFMPILADSLNIFHK
jgi:hypothetical protein